VDNSQREKTWKILQSRAEDALKSTMTSLEGVRAELSRVSTTIEQLVGMKTDYQFNNSEIEATGSIDTSSNHLHRQWAFITNLEVAIRNARHQQIELRKSELSIQDRCTRYQRELDKFKKLGQRASSSRLNGEQKTMKKQSDEIATAFWLRNQSRD
jgi:flagellar export protein FliJ